MRTLSTPTSNAVTGTNTAPAYLIRIGWTTVTRLTTGDAALSWDGYLWVPAEARLTGIGWDKTGALSGSLILGNAEQQFSALALNEGVADVDITIWAYDRSATAAGDPVKVFDGFGGRLSANDDAINIELAAQRSRALKAPRQRVTRANGFSLLPAAGTIVRWGSQIYRIE